MKHWLASPRTTLLIGVAVALAVAIFAIATPRADAAATLGLLARVAHVGAAMVWVGLVVFVNFVQFAVLAETAAAERGALAQRLAPRVAGLCRSASTLTVASGAILLATSGYVLSRFVFGTDVDLGGARHGLMGLGVAGGVAMWAFVHMMIWPALQVVLGLRPGDEAAKAAARDKVQLFARLNLLLAFPVTALMIAAAHAP